MISSLLINDLNTELFNLKKEKKEALQSIQVLKLNEFKLKLKLIDASLKLKEDK